MTQINPFLRWAGGKKWITNQLKLILGDISINHYHEPFLGSAAVFFSLETKKTSYLSDANSELVTTYKAIKDYPLEVIETFQNFFNNEEQYYLIRAMNPRDDIERAARFIYLNQTSYNGLYRVNRQGGYNVPYGFRETMIYNTDRILIASQKLKKTNLSHGDFTINKYKIQQGDLVFLDPPYTVSHNNNGFIEYNQNLFSLKDQYRLSKFIDYIKAKGAHYILTNAAHSTIREIFDKGDRVLELNRYSLIGGKNSKRKKITEFVFTNIFGGEANDKLGKDSFRERTYSCKTIKK
ncbi:MAG: Dam family site-specific DNA-(adenine-N6)-methyltransferase [Sporomusaceae bacterium]|nr:Dam family site-specific DNA-(adenine-N6)-methyltransferase [Sporomusaceae bacterium]